VADRDWLDWHRRYDDPTTALAGRLAVVRERVAAALDACPPGPVRVVSVCAGQGRDLLGVLPGHPRRNDVRARLVELDERNVDIARAAAAGLDNVEVVAGDASVTDAYAGAVPADVVLFCGVLGNLSDADAARAVGLLPQLCTPGATLIWTRHRNPPDLTVAIRGWLAATGFEELSFDGPEDVKFGVGANRYVGEPVPLRAGVRLFTFQDGALASVDRAAGPTSVDWAAQPSSVDWAAQPSSIDRAAQPSSVEEEA
jgi:hypothetical protein